MIKSIMFVSGFMVMLQLTVATAAGCDKVPNNQLTSSVGAYTGNNAPAKQNESGRTDTSTQGTHP